MSTFDKAFDAFVNWQTLVFCLGIYIVTFFLRTLVEVLFPTVKVKPVWTELFVPFGPIGTGILLAFADKKFPWPMPLAESTLAKVFYGGICGMASGWIYARFRAWLKVAADKNPDGRAAKMLGRSTPPVALMGADDEGDRPTPPNPPTLTPPAEAKPDAKDEKPATDKPAA
jgi:hypothetical protein